MRHLEIIYSSEIIHSLIQFFKPPRPEMESVNELMEVAGDTFEGLKRQTRAGLKHALESHNTFDIDVDVYAPIIIIPIR
jgi:vacuolar protein sorting-associated protein 13A/C